MTRIVEDYSSRGASHGLKSRRYSIAYIVSDVAANLSPHQVLALVGLPVVRLSTWPGDPYALCQSGDPEQLEASIWRVQYEYSTQKNDPAEDAVNPLDRPVKRDWGEIEYPTFPYQDLDGKVIMASNHQLMPGAVEIPKSYGVLTITRNEASFDYREARKYKNKVNSDTFYDAPKESVLCKPITATEAWDQNANVYYYPVTYRFHFADEGETFFAEVIDHGTYFIRPSFSTEDPLAIEKYLPEADGVKFSDDFLLDGHGRELPKTRKESGDVEKLKFRRYKKKAFGPLNLEPS